MLPRTLEPEAMDTLDEARDYDAIDHREVNGLFAGDALVALQQTGLLTPNSHCHVIDIGTGTARIPIELVRRAREAGVAKGLVVAAVDLAAEMLVVAKENVAAAGMADVIRLERLDVKTLPYPDERFVAVLSNSIVHHIPEPAEAIAEAVRVTRPGGLLFFRDLRRPIDQSELDRLVALHAAGGTESQRAMLAASLHAALTVDEMAAIVASLGFPPGDVRATSDRHWTWRSVKP
jgi:ubiquinone/menaquinone biosynthesis C-methylase UbiE